MIRVIRNQMPTLDAALIRFDNWWDGLSPRERMLVSVLGAILAVVVLVYGVVKPIQGARAAALADIRTYETLNARVLAAGTLTTAKAPRRQGAPATVAQQSATALGLTIAAQPADGGLRVTLTDAQYDTVLAWLADLAGTSDLRVRGIALTRGTQPGRVSGTVDLGA